MRHKIVLHGLVLVLIVGTVLTLVFYTVQVRPGQLGTPAKHPTAPSPASQDVDSQQTAAESSKSGQNSGKASHISDQASTLAMVPESAALNGTYYPVRTYAPLLTPDDPGASQWWETNTRMPEMWDVPAGNSPTLLAIIDTGFALDHEEFTNRWYGNPGESGATASQGVSQRNCADRGLALNASCNLIDDNGDRIIDNESGAVNYQNPSRLNCTDQAKSLAKDCNLLDDDTNGYIDDYRGWDFINYDNSTQAGELHPQGSGVTHGTGVAGIAAATGNNGKGIAGVNWNTKILPLQALDDDSYGNSLSVARAITYAAAQGADVISLSLGSDLPDEYVRQAVQAATAAGSVVVAASGNDGCNCMMYPANYPEVVAVGALAPNNAPAGFSSWGTNLDILAPGSDLDVPTWSANNKTQAYALNVSGTSFAAPIVSGMLARLAGQQPAATPLQLIAALTEQTNRLTIPASAPQTHTLGYGKLDGYSAAARMAAAKNSVQTYAFSPASKGDFSAFTQSEVTGSGAVQACEAGKLGTTQLYEIYKGNTTFFTISKAEMAKAQAAGYTVNSFAHICLQQPHDTSGSIRSINLFKEFRNLDKVTQ